MTNIKIDHFKVEQVEQFCYLGSIITNDNRSTTEIKKRIALMRREIYLQQKSKYREEETIYKILHLECAVVCL